MEAKATPNVVLLNGPSSSPKTSVASPLQELFAEPYFYLRLDTFVRTTCRYEIAIDLTYYDRLFAPGLHRSAAFYANSGANVIVDHCLIRANWTQDLRRQLVGCRVYFVGFYCSIDRLEAREEARADRPLGLARSQVELVHQHGPYDVEVNTSEQSVDQCAAAIHDFVTAHPPTGFLAGST